jgi:hypothetical protein
LRAEVAGKKCGSKEEKALKFEEVRSESKIGSFGLC